MCTAFVGAMHVVERQFDWELHLDPRRLSVVEYETGRYQLIDPRSSPGKAILEGAYGPYAPVVAQGTFPFSYARPQEFTLPRIDAEGRKLLLREAPGLRIELWQHSPPQVVLLGSSMMFMGFNRQRFFSRTGNARLIDMTLTGNWPETTDFELDQLFASQVAVPAGTLFLYGLGDFELSSPPCGAPVPDAVATAFQTMADGPQPSTWRERFVAWAGLPNTRAQSLKWVRSWFDDPAANRLAASIVDDPPALARYGAEYIVPLLLHARTPQPCESAVQVMRHVIQRLTEAGGDVVVVRLPSASPRRAVEGMPGRERDNADGVLAELSRDPFLQFRFIDLSDPASLGLDDRAFILPGSRTWDVAHLNWEGGVRLTDYLLDAVILPGLSKAAPVR